MKNGLIFGFLSLFAVVSPPMTSGAVAAPDVSWVFGNAGVVSYTLDSFAPTTSNLGMLGAENPALTLQSGKRYQVTVSNFSSHPFEVIAKGATAAADMVLLSMTAHGSFEADPEVAWQDDGNGSAAFTMTKGLYNAMFSGNNAPGYRCGTHVTSMRGDFRILNVGIAGDVNNDEMIDFTDALVSLQNSAGLRDMRDMLTLVHQDGTQPGEAGIFAPVSACQLCHSNFDGSTTSAPDGIKEGPYDTWKGTMMANSARDPIFWALVAVENKLFASKGIAIGDYCLRCHVPKGWLEGRSEPVDGSAFVTDDLAGVLCDVCHRMVDPVSTEGQGLVSPAVDVHRNAQFVLTPSTISRRGPYADPANVPNHASQKSDFHLSSEICATCHEITNPFYGNAVVVEKTYTEWNNSAFAAEGKECQSCHMPRVSGYAAQSWAGGKIRQNNIPLHEFVGGNAWAPLAVHAFDDTFSLDAAMVIRTRAIQKLQSAAGLDAIVSGNELQVKVTNLTGHKLPTGYTEGRRMWLNVKFFGENDALLMESGGYDTATGVLTMDDALKVYEAKPGLLGMPGFPDGPSFHFALNNHIFKDNRIPPRGFTNVAFESNGAYIVGATYPDGQNWDVTTYSIPAGTLRLEVILNYQSTSREFIEFLRDENIGNEFDVNGAGQMIYAIWENTGRAAPVVMKSTSVAL